MFAALVAMEGDKDIIENTQNKIETRIYMGEKFGNEKN